MPKTAACSEEKQFLCPEMKIWGTCSKCSTGTQVPGQGIRKGLYTCPHSLTAGFMLWSNRSSSREDWVKEGVRGMELPDIAKWLRQTQIWHSHELLCSVNATSSSCPGPSPAAWACGMRSALRVPALTRNFCSNRSILGHTMGTCRCLSTGTKIGEKLGNFCLIFPVQPWQINQ